MTNALLTRGSSGTGLTNRYFKSINADTGPTPEPFYDDVDNYSDAIGWGSDGVYALPAQFPGFVTSLETDVAFRTELSDELMTFLTQSYSFDREAITDFLCKHPSVEPALREAPEQIHGFFGDAVLSLDIDFELSESRREEMTIIITSQAEPERALEQLDSLRSQWWRSYPKEIREILFVTVD